MPKFQPLGKLKCKKVQPFIKVCTRKFTKMDAVDLQALFNQIQNMEQRIAALQEENNNLRQQQQQLQEQRVQLQAPVVENRRTDFYRIPDPIRTIPSYDGNKKQLSSWLSSARRTLNLFRPLVTAELLAVYEQAIINKIDGKARDTICVNGNPNTFEEAAEILLSVYGDRNNIATYQTQLWSLKMTDSLHIYYKRTKEIMINMKSLARQNETYNRHWEAINLFLEQECLAAFINGLSKPYFGYAQTAQPSDLETAYAFLCRFQNAERTKNQTQAAFDQQPQSSKSVKPANKPFNKQTDMQFPARPRPMSDRQRPTPMEIDPSLRSNQNKIFNHNAEQNDSDEPAENNDTEDELDESDVNFQITPNHITPT